MKIPASPPALNDANIRFEIPTSTDGAAVHALVASTPPLDPNSLYCNLLQCSHFAATSIKAVQNRQIVGFISGYRLPEQPQTLFIWQVAVAAQARGQGLAGQMLMRLVQRTGQAMPVTHIETTITPDNVASWALFKSLARRLNAPWQSQVLFSRDAHFDGKHADEHCLRIGPFAAASGDAPPTHT